MAELEGQSIAPPVLVNNVETLANIPGIVAHGATWFRSIGTLESPGSVVCTVTGAVRQPCVVEVAMGTTLDEVLSIAGGPTSGLDVRMVLVGVAGAVVLPAEFATALTYEAMAPKSRACCPSSAPAPVAPTTEHGFRGVSTLWPTAPDVGWQHSSRSSSGRSCERSKLRLLRRSCPGRTPSRRTSSHRCSISVPLARNWM
jgi:hypothetical protein